MSTILSVQPSKSSSIPASLQEIFSCEFLDRIAKQTRALKRDRKFNFNAFVKATMAMFNCSPKEQNVTIAAAKRSYDSRVLQSNVIKPKPFYNQLDKPEVQSSLEELLSVVLAFALKVSGQSAYKQMGRIKRLLTKHKFDDIIMVDGCEVVLDDDAYANFKTLGFNCSGKGRKHKNGDKPAPALKLHVAYSLKYQTFVYIDVTGVCENERAHVPYQSFHNTLFIMDRGYVSDELEEEIAASGNYFLIRGKKSTAGRIICLSDTYGHVIQHKYAGMAVKEVELPEFDAEVRFGKDHTIRIVKCQIRDPKSGGMVISYFRTNVPRENLGLKQCGYLYRLRWSIELMNKVCKSYNGMSTVNSSKPHIIIEFLLLSLLSTLFKTIMAHLTQAKFKLEYISMLKVHELSVQFERLLTSLILGSKRRISQIVKELLAYMAEHCLRSKPSRTNRKLVKDFPRQVEKILRLKNPWQIKMA
ncbi:MAG: IS4 family transposase [Succinivibrio sp.]|nr:IS4 family transposase [Succinivibrio sp.]